MNFLDLFFPKFNLNLTNFDKYLSQKEVVGFQSKMKILKKPQRQYLSGVFVLTSYKDKLINDLIHRAKFGGEFTIAKDLAKAIKYSIFEDGSVFIPDPDIIVPVPHDPQRILQRGYNLSTLISTELSNLIDIENKNVLKKIRGTIPQTSLNREGRQSNLKDAFAFDSQNPHNFSNTEIIWIIDDISTTGATLVECAKTIKKQYPYVSIYGIVVASN
jgi:ComF family protein